MSSKDDATTAVEALKKFPELTGVSMSFVAIGSGADGALAPYKIGLTEEAKTAIAAIAETTRMRLQDSSLLAYGPAVLIPPQHWMHVPVGEAATLQEIDAMVKQEDAYAFNSKSKDAPTIKMIAAHFRQDQTDVTFYRIADSLLELRKAKVIGLFQEGEVYRKLEPSDVLLLREDFDVVVINGVALFRKKPTFEKAFGFFEELKKSSLATFTAVTAHLKIKGIDELQKACTTQPQMMAKMASIKRSMDEDSQYAGAMTMDNLVDYIFGHIHIEIEVEGTDDDRQLVFDNSAAKRFQILKLLDDDFLHSTLTSRDYEAGSKLRAGAPQS